MFLVIGEPEAGAVPVEIVAALEGDGWLYVLSADLVGVLPQNAPALLSRALDMARELGWSEAGEWKQRGAHGLCIPICKAGLVEKGASMILSELRLAYVPDPWMSLVYRAYPQVLETERSSIPVYVTRQGFPLVEQRGDRKALEGAVKSFDLSDADMAGLVRWSLSRAELVLLGAYEALARAGYLVAGLWLAVLPYSSDEASVDLDKSSPPHPGYYAFVALPERGE